MPSGVLDDLPSLSELPPEPTDGEPQSVELLFWESIKGSTRIADYEAYLRQYPEGSFVALARTRLGEFASAAGGMRDPKDREVEPSLWETASHASLNSVSSSTRSRASPSESARDRLVAQVDERPAAV